MTPDAPKSDGAPERQDPPTFTPRTEFGDQSTKSKAVGRPGCPSEETLILLASGVDDDATRAAAVHAATCAMCKSQLALLVRDEHFVAGVRGMISTPRQALGDGQGERQRRLQEESEAFILPGYAVEGEIHRGGQGIVYRAIQLDTKRAVAVKMLLRGAFATPRELRRFEREVEIAASLRHPHIVTIYDNITLDDGRSALAMELVEGVTIDAWARGRVKGEPDRQPRTIRERAAMVAAIARAVQYAHNRAIIHRDLKPANVLVDTEDQPHVLDFGLARRTVIDHETAVQVDSVPHEASTFVSLAGIFNGTPAYASPEQLSGDPLLVDTRCDVYALGVVLYELVTGRLPTSFDDNSPDVRTDAGGIEAIIAKKTSGRFPTPMEAAEITKSPRVDADLDAIIMKAMAVDKDARYQTADRFAGDIDRYLAGEAVAARSGERSYRARKTVRKYRKSLGAGGVVVGAALGFGVYYAVVAARLDENAIRLKDQTRTLASQRDEIMGRRDALRVELDRSEVRLARAELQLGSMQRAEAALVPAVLSKPGLDDALESWGSSAPPEVLRVYWALWEWAAASRIRSSVRIDGDMVVGAGSRGDTVRSVSRGGHVDEWTLPGLRRQRVWDFEGFELARPDSLFTESERMLQLTPEQATVWRVGVPRAVRTWPRSIANSIRLIQGTDDVAYVNGKRQLLREPVDPSKGPPVVLNERGPDPARAKWTSAGDFICAQEDRDGEPVLLLWSTRDGGVRTLKFPPDLSRLARLGATLGELEASPSQNVIALHWSGEFMIWDLPSGNLVRSPMSVNEKASSMRFGPSGNTVALGQSFTSRTLVYDLSGLADSKTLGVPLIVENYSGFPVIARSDPARPDEWLVAMAPGLLRVWDIRPQRWGRNPDFPASSLRGTAVPPANAGQGVSVTLGVADPYKKSLHCATFSPDSSMMATGSNQGIISIWSSGAGGSGEQHRELVTQDGREIPYTARVVSDLAFSPDSSRLASTSYDGAVRIFDIRTDKLLAKLSVGEARKTAVAFTLDGLSVVYGTGVHKRFNVPGAGPVTDMGGEVWLWNFGAPGEPPPILLWKHAARVSKLARQPGGALIASVSPDRTVTIGTSTLGGPPISLAHPVHPRCLAFSPAGDVLATGADDHIFRLWDVRTGKLTGQWPGYGQTCTEIAFYPLPRPPGKSVLLFSLYDDGKLFIWDTRTGEQVANFQAHEPGWAPTLSIAPDGTRFVTAGFDGSLRTWDLSWYRAHIKDAIELWRTTPPRETVASPGK